jgi:heptosyltransferase III
MKILVLQLARFGDIYQSWPAVRALKRAYPEAEITLVVREKFKAAAVGLAEVDHVRTLDTAKVLSPILFHGSTQGALTKIGEFVDCLSAEKFDRIVNLSFSPFSSFLVHSIANSETVVTGYSRTEDGYLAIPDDASAYFYAQAGTDRWSRVHLTDLFALIAGVELTSPDWHPPNFTPYSVFTEKSYIAVQPGASQANKTLTPAQWANVVQTLLLETSHDIVFVGAKEERQLYEWPKSDRIVDLMGQSTLPESMAVIAKAVAFIGPDSVGLHISSLTNTPAFNVSIGPVRFWETGPRATGSRVLKFESVESFELGTFWREFLSFIAGSESENVYKLRGENGVAYSGPKTDEASEFQWRLSQALYMNSDYPTTQDRVLTTAFSRIAELADLGLEQIDYVRSEKTREIGFSILNEIDNLLEKVCEFEPRVRPLVNWFLTQKLRIGPGDFENVLTQTTQCFADLQTITRVYGLPVEWNEALPEGDLAWKP